MASELESDSTHFTKVEVEPFSKIRTLAHDCESDLDELCGLAFSYLEELQTVRAEKDRLREDLMTAIGFLKEGKAKFAPHTTNSFVDEFLDKYKDL